MRIAFIGLGHMGAPMASNLQKAGHEVAGFDLSADAARAAGVPLAASAADAVAGAEVVISMLPASRHVEALYFGEGLLDRIAAGTLVIDSSTIASATSRKLAEAGAARGLAVLDAPVSGGTAGAAAGTLTFMVGGDAAHLERARPVLEKMGANIFHAGGAGAGQAAKMCNNMLLGILMIGTSEALALGVANGLDPAVLSEIMRRSSGGNWALEKYNPFPGVMPNVPASKGYSGGFGGDLMLKDLGLAMDNAVQAGAATPLGSLARSLYAAHSLAGHGALDFSSILKALQRPA
ncbi:3-hydroxyisobutyrate dehydrogenase [Piscinibacter gummiphilus]|uniref:3-hydroxyisobutyrate dehydrogenase n=1 Tax=Piscinibacter gummiphilus TaxID=946333 RepID=A0A1W6LES3_9BURK|nr:3-hydroxyisobutyrate dehydrogenase [Piscinibacter gummiphilus]ARN22772.1 3-hydroxyisobutyrate dehydrogenase [Piscinibacter gummiphilus]ATU67468.1 3-hydroxyisobutyrate dehydrogenase [Piscinibacter gummiphilus]GLS96580.1 3-hydroxyisobutyrate dehydrogenase [Piscinibacter gummiphilus]